MKKYLYYYHTIIRFSTPVSQHAFRLRCVPTDSGCQSLEKEVCYISPTVKLLTDTDAWGNKIQYGFLADAHDSFTCVSSGIAVQKEYAYTDSHMPEEIYLTSTELTTCSEAMLAAARDVSDAGSVTHRAAALSTFVHDALSYQANSSAVTTTAAQAFDAGVGVCQDFAHILIALCRSCGIHARYVAGLMVGEGATHAWVEVLDGDKWIGIDPTHNIVIDYGYIKIAHGRDADDCPVNRGVFCGAAAQTTDVRVIVEEI